VVDSSLDTLTRGSLNRCRLYSCGRSDSFACFVFLVEATSEVSPPVTSNQSLQLTAGRSDAPSLHYENAHISIDARSRQR
jgi:hypothetical protein